MSDFWQRQFSPALTYAQMRFDVIVGLVAPVVGFVTDLWFLRGAMTVVYWLSPGAMALGILTLALWLVFDNKIRSPANGLVAGILLWEALYAILAGGLFFLFTAMAWVFGSVIMREWQGVSGALIGLGLLGLVPFFTAFVFLRNGYRALQRARNDMSALSLASSMLAAAMMVLLVAILGGRVLWTLIA